MFEETPARAVSSLDQQVSLVKQLTQQTRRLMLKSGEMLPSSMVDDLNSLINNLVRLEKQITQRKEEQENLLALAEVSQVVNSSLELGEVLRIVMDTIVRLTGAERGFLMLRNEQGELVTYLARNWEQETIDPSEFAVSRTIINRVASEGRAVLTTNAKEDPRFGGQDSIVFHNLRSILCAPLKVKGELTGVIYADNRMRSGIFNESERSLLAAFANQAAVAIENARLFESVRRTLAEVTQLKSLMDNIFASIASGVITADIEDHITLINRAAKTILGQDDIELVGHCLEDALPGLSAELSRHVSAVRHSDRSLVGLEFNPTLPGRGLVNLSLNLSPLRDTAQTTQGVAIVLDDLTEKKSLEAQRRLFERMVSPAVINHLDPDQLQLGGSRAEISCLFADIRGFTSFSEQLSPETLVSVLNCYLAEAANAVLAQEGTIDKFLGDAIMAWFNAPIAQPDHALRAVKAALGIRSAVSDLQCTFPPELHLSFGAGIHYGVAILGLVGTEKRLEYTAIGDSINTAKRIQENAVGGQILISATTYPLIADEVLVRPVESLLVKGKRQPIEVYEVLGLR